MAKDLKHKLLNSILQSIKQLSNILVVLSPVLAKNNQANLEGATFELTGVFSETPDRKLHQIIGCTPSNMINWYVDQLFSQKMGTLFGNKMDQELDHYKKHYLALMIITKRPKNWEKAIVEYILSVDKNSFYLMDVINCLKSEYKFSYTSEPEVSKLGSLIKLCLGRHNKLIKKINVSKARNLPDDYLPDRQV